MTINSLIVMVVVSKSYIWDGFIDGFNELSGESAQRHVAEIKALKVVLFRFGTPIRKTAL